MDDFGMLSSKRSLRTGSSFTLFINFVTSDKRTGMIVGDTIGATSIESIICSRIACFAAVPRLFVEPRLEGTHNRTARNNPRK